ncbi:unnamed protein product [Adineta steineri]|uniref:Uncharacterized protein n=1 Tax=Adineta steineri TaxID=433720 RepID=A0A815DPN4_9BILA|nr:unnamed protein product [Adineta steineri]CAF1575564.1 unnamed protein product [Adineta steineri]
MYSPLELPDDVLDYHGKNFYDLVREKCGEIIKDFMEILYIDSVKTLLGVEDDIFSLLKENCNALKHIKEQACLCLDDGKIVVKPGLRLDFDRFVEALRVKSIQSHLLQSTTISFDNNSSLLNTITTFNHFEKNNNSFLNQLFNNIASNKIKSKNNYRYNAKVQNFAQALYIMGGRNTYEFFRLNLPGAVPSITSIDSYITKAGGTITEGEFRYDTLRQLQAVNDYQLAICSEDCTSVIQKIVYNATSNTFIGFSTPLNHGIPVPQYFQTDSYELLEEWFENNNKSSLLNVHMLELLSVSKYNSYPFLLGAYGITSQFNSIDVLRRWLWIFEQSRLSNIRILVFSTDCDAKYLRAMRLITEFFAKLPNIHVSERSDAFEVKLPKQWSNWFFMRTRQLCFCFQDPVHLCTKIRNRLLSQSASLIIGEGKVSTDVLFDVINNQSKLIHGLVKTDIYPKDKQNFGSCIKISSVDVLSALEGVSGSYATQIYLRLLRSIILAYIERSTSILNRLYHSWLTVFICRLWWSWLLLTDVEKLSTDYQDNTKNAFFITKAAYHSIEINAHTLLSIVLLVCQHDLPESALSISSFNSQTCENIFRLTRSMSGTFSSNVNFTVDQFLRRAGKLSVLQDIERQHEHDESGCSLEFPKHHKRRYKKAASPNNHSQDVSDNLTHDTIQNAIFRAFNDAYKMLSVLDIDKTLKKSHKSTLNEISTFVRVQIERKSHTTDYSENWDEYSDEESDSEQVNTSDDCYVSTESSSEDETEELLSNSNQKASEFKGIRIFNEISSSKVNSYFRIKHDGNKKYMHKQTACWLLTDNKPTLSADRLRRVQQSKN